MWPPAAGARIELPFAFAFQRGDLECPGMKSENPPFKLGAWLVEPQLNRLQRPDGTTVQLEPKMMDVLVCLARQAGEVVSREQLIDAVWPDLFISESVLTRAIAGIRRAFGDNARQPSFVETIAKRGYRLLNMNASPPANFSVAAGEGARVWPYVVGQWVRADGFYGRGEQLREVLEGPRNGFWVVGTRRRGKTSLLKQLEHLAAAEESHRFVPVFWDLEGTDDDSALAFSFEEALFDAEPRLEEVGISLPEVVDEDLFRMLGALRRRLSAAGSILLLLCDEAEELLNIASASEATIRRLHRALLAHDGTRTVLASGPRLWDLASGSKTSPFLDGFLPPLYLGPLKPPTARALVLQNQLPGGKRPELSDEEVKAICHWGGGHPFLLQLLSKRVVEFGDVDQGVAAVVADRSVTTLFEIDLELLDDRQREILHTLARQKDGAGIGDADSAAVQELEQLGLIVSYGTGERGIALPLFGNWLRES